MPAVFPISYAFTFGLLFCRLAPALRLVPFFGGDPMPAPAWLSLSTVLALVLLPLAPSYELPSDVPHFAAQALKEIFIGIVIGILCRLAFSIFESAGHLARRAMFSTPFVAETDTSARIYNLIGIAALLLLGGHHTLIQGFAATLRCAPLHFLPDASSQGGVNAVLTVFGSAMGAATLIAAPIFAAGLISDLILASASRLLSGAIASAADAARVLVVQLAIISTFSIAVQTALRLIIEGLEKLPSCTP